MAMESATQQQPKNRRGAHLAGKGWPKGVSGNPAGRPPKSKGLRELERVTRQQATQVLEKLAGPALRVLQQALAGRDRALAVKAAIDVLDRTQGKALQKIDATVTANESVTTVDVATLRAAALKLLAAQAVDAQPRETADAQD